MHREIVECPIAPPRGRLRKDVVQEDYAIELITPLFGGGVQAGRNDPITPIRVPGIRGQLRFWWRATRGARLNNIAELRQREAEIWGATERPSRIKILVTVLHRSEPSPCLKYVWNSNKKRGAGGFDMEWLPPFGSDTALPYVLFPFQGTPPRNTRVAAAGQAEPSERVDHATFRLTVEYPLELKTDLDSSLWAWINFGGVGARTRRGCGALFCRDFAPPSSSGKAMKDWFLKFGTSFSDQPAIQKISSLQCLPLATLIPAEPISAWETAVSLYQAFRQEGVGRKSRPSPQRRLSGSNLPGRSYWPEPETIRRLEDRRMPRHQPLDTGPDAFPRAELGLPIIFHFKDEKAGDPTESELYPASPYETGRMASPLIIKPLAVGSAASAVPLILRLTTPQITGVRLKKKSNHSGLGEDEFSLSGQEAISAPVLANYHTSPLKGRSPAGSALEAFIEFALKNGFQEVGR